MHSADKRGGFPLDDSQNLRDPPNKNVFKIPNGQHIPIGKSGQIMCGILDMMIIHAFITLNSEIMLFIIPQKAQSSVLNCLQNEWNVHPASVYCVCQAGPRRHNSY